ncbi:MAG: FG-GAP-like repeat-containing protein, partial [Ignavibacteria bacterium]|nr:FG-GAP-like repeat-containing protein [Ignavibacteria bacterium]
LNSDSHIDLAVVTQNDVRLLVLTGNGDGTFNTAIEYTTSGDPYDLKIADFDNDLDMDIAVGNGGGSSFYIHYNDGAGDFSTKINQSTPSGPPTFLEVGFMNADIYLDIVSAKGGVTEGSLDILLNDQTGNFSQSAVVTPGGYMHGLSLAQIDTNAFLDAVSINQTGLYISFGDGAGNFLNTDTVASFTTENPQALSIEDFNKDGFNDIVVCNDYSVFIFMQTGNATSLEDQPNTTPAEFVLDQNYPNPFNPSTKISWQTTESGLQTLKVYDVLGNEVATLVNEYKPVGNYEVEFTAVETLRATSLPSGIYFYKLQAGSYLETRKMILLK